MKIRDLNINFKEKIKELIEVLREFFYEAKEGNLSWYFLIKLAVANLRNSFSRVMITSGAIMLGTGAIVVLVSFGFGLQGIVTQRLIYPNARRIADVQSSSTALSLNDESIKKITEISGVEDYGSAISAAGFLEIKGSKTDVVVIATQNKFLKYGNYYPARGDFFSDEADKKYEASGSAEIADLLNLSYESKVLGLTNSKADPNKIEEGKEINGETIRFRIKEDEFLPIREQPDKEAAVIGYVKGEMLRNYQAKEIWGGQYVSTNTAGKFYQEENGEWYGKWIKTKLPVYEEKAPTVFVTKNNENGSQIMVEGYLPEINIHILSMDEISFERQMAQLRESKKDLLSKVLGESSESAELGFLMETSSESAKLDNSDNLAVVSEGSSETVNELTQLVQSKGEEENKLETELAVLNVKKEGGKEILLSTALLKTLELDSSEVLSNEVGLEYILSGGTVSGLNTKIKSNVVTYKIVGIVEDSRSLVFTPMGDLQSMGADRYSSLKVLAVDNNQLANVRSQIEAVGFTTQSLVDTLAQVEKLFTLMRFLLASFGMVALVVAVAGMFNTLTISLLERTREIAVMKTLGTIDRDVLKLFIIESVMVGIIGGFLGNILGLVIGGLFNLIFKLINPEVKAILFYSPLWFLILILFLAILVGFLTGIYPAKRAKAISALNALRYE